MGASSDLTASEPHVIIQAVNCDDFDEVDTGVSGRAAQKVARKMSDVARHKQVLCVTHLPQIAAMADIHFSTQRQKELARLAGGERVTEALLHSTGEMLDQAEQWKRDQN